MKLQINISSCVAEQKDVGSFVNWNVADVVICRRKCEKMIEEFELNLYKIFPRKYCWPCNTDPDYHITCPLLPTWHNNLLNRVAQHHNVLSAYVWLIIPKLLGKHVVIRYKNVWSSVKLCASLKEGDRDTPVSLNEFSERQGSLGGIILGNDKFRWALQ